MRLSKSANDHNDTFVMAMVQDEEIVENHSDINDELQCDKTCELLNKIDATVSVYGLIPLCVIGALFNLASIGALFNNKLRLRRSLVQLFIFLNTSDV